MKIGLSQIGAEAPISYRRFLNVLIIIIVPATATLITELPPSLVNMSDDLKVFVGKLAVYLVAILKAIEFILGSNNDDNNA